MAPAGNESRQLLQDFRVEKSNGRIVKRFQDEFYAFDLLKVLEILTNTRFESKLLCRIDFIH